MLVYTIITVQVVMMGEIHVNRQGELWIFDMDGTLFDSPSIAEETFMRTFARLRQEGVRIPDVITRETIQKTYGYTHDLIWPTLFERAVTHEERELADRIILEVEVALLREGQGRLYLGVADTLARLHQDGAMLAVASNGQQSYIETILDVSGIRDWFAGLYSASGYRVTSKIDLVQILLREIPHETAVMVGDRDSDVEAGMYNELFTIGCTYGFGGADEIAKARVKVSDLREILAVEWH